MKCSLGPSGSRGHSARASQSTASALWAWADGSRNRVLFPLKRPEPPRHQWAPPGLSRVSVGPEACLAGDVVGRAALGEG